MEIIKLISKISEEAGALAPTKNPAGGVPFSYRGIDSTVNHLSPLLHKYGVITVPEIVSITVTPTPNGNRTVKTTEVVTRYRFYAPDGSHVDSTTAGLADDFGDRSTAQAQSVAFRVALLQTFTLPTDSPDPEETGQVVQDGIAKGDATAPPKAPAEPKLDEVGKLRAEIGGYIVGEESAYDAETVNSLGNQIAGAGKSPEDWGADKVVLKKLIAALKKGEMPA